jgi:hypothetical protein
MSKTVEKIVLKNFKAFRQEQPIDFKNKNLIIYGNNGAGKSSIFWALYTFLQSSIKTKEGVEKYFKVFDVADETTHQSLRNVFEDAEETSYIELHVREDGELKKYKIPAIESAETIPAAEPATVLEPTPSEIESAEAADPVVEMIGAETPVPSVVEVPVDLSPITPTTESGPPAVDTNVKVLNTTSDFINYKLLSGFYNNSHKYDVNLWSVFERDIFPFITDNVNDKTFLEKIIENTEDVERYESGYKLRPGWRKEEYIAWLESDVNGLIDTTLERIQNFANEFIKEHFYDDKDVLKVQLTFDKRFTFDLIEHRLWEDGHKHLRDAELQIKLVVLQYDLSRAAWIALHRVQSFLNEAQLTRIAIGIRIGALRTTRIQSTEFKLLVLDDMLISLDLSNRMEVIKIILNHNNKASLKFFDNFQKIILTHDKGFYNILKNYTNPNQWEYYKLTKDENSNEAPHLKSDKTHIEKATTFLADGEFDAVGNELRKEVELIIKKYLNQGLNKENEEFQELSKMLKAAHEKFTLNERRAFEKLFVDNGMSLDLIKKINENFEADTTLSPEEIGRLKNKRRFLFQYLIKQYEVKENKDKLFDEIKTILDRIMNPASHASGEAMYDRELQNAISRVHELKRLLDESRT